jgi:hypothetical protein
MQSITFTPRGRNRDGHLQYWAEPPGCWLIVCDRPTRHRTRWCSDPIAWMLAGTTSDGNVWETDWYGCASVEEALSDAECYLIEQLDDSSTL